MLKHTKLKLAAAFVWVFIIGTEVQASVYTLSFLATGNTAGDIVEISGASVPALIRNDTLIYKVKTEEGYVYESGSDTTWTANIFNTNGLRSGMFSVNYLYHGSEVANYIVNIGLHPWSAVHEASHVVGMYDEVDFAVYLLQGAGSVYDGVQRLYTTANYIRDPNYVIATSVVPEPTSMVLLGLGALGLAVSRKKTKHSDTPHQPDTMPTTA